ncbi:hypothetical protein NLM33_41130 [Bradyrhizobium sp. CCGUVB1N3]|uniref:hypothetical protein n=1 Tax=Bradyrhizobium sp. CCGUVB1N3 TaxID=2949629 RepID=UPI0020B2F3C3|nr:hypothetical protein [Bradyrhizobium sp. CCGUVB1N3]MCP3476598.1 hypothetical protein [Bradyrhizobium sp. CCGUVB1N3]
MEQNSQQQQLDLLELATNAIQRQQLGPIVRAEIVSLLKLLLDECGAGRAKVSEVNDE